MSPEEILNIPMRGNDSGATNIRGYLKALLVELWREGEGFSGKRPFGNSGWKYDLLNALVEAGAVKGTVTEEDGYREVEHEDDDAARSMISQAIAAL